MTREFGTNHTVLTYDFWEYSFPLHVHPCLHVCLVTSLHPLVTVSLTHASNQWQRFLSNDMQLPPCFSIIQSSMLYQTNCLCIYTGKCYQENILHPIKMAATTHKCTVTDWFGCPGNLTQKLTLH